MTTETFSVACAGAGYFAQFHHAAVEATYAAKRAAHKAEFIAQAMAEGASQAEAEQLASQAGH